jgi:hypothetical protein
VKKYSDKSKNQETQLDLGLKSPFRNKLFEIKERISKFFAYLEVFKFLREPLNWFFITLSLFFIGMQAYFIYKTLGSLPNELPIFSYFTNLEKKLGATVFIYSLPALSVIIALVGTRLSYKYFHKERVMSALLLLSVLLSITLITLFTLKLTLPFYG